jgi:NADH-quinone oxidoreductase subunit F
MGYADMERFIMEDCGGIRNGNKAERLYSGRFERLHYARRRYYRKKGFDGLRRLVAGGSLVGSGGFIVIDDTVDIVDSTKNLSEFYKHESCGWCTPCREGTDWLVKISTASPLAAGDPKSAQLILDLVDNIEGKSFCALGDAAAWAIQGRD